jgi:hypothetical protein
MTIFKAFKLLSGSLLLTASSLLSNVALGFAPISLHIGADYDHVGARPTTIFRETFPEIHSGKNFYGGIRFAQCPGWDWGLDLGYERSNLGTANALLLTGDSFFGAPAVAGDQTHLETRIQGWHTDFMIYKPLIPCRFDLLFTAGIAQQRPRAKIDYTHVGTGITEAYNIHNQSKTIGRFGFGGQWMLSKWFGLRGLATWSNYKHFEYHGERLNIAGTEVERFDGRPYKSSMGLYLGIVAQTSPITHWPI